MRAAGSPPALQLVGPPSPSPMSSHAWFHSASLRCRAHHFCCLSQAVWNYLDSWGLGLTIAWFISRFLARDDDACRVFLNLSAIPMAFGLMRYMSFDKSLGQLVLTVFGNVYDLLYVMPICISSAISLNANRYPQELCDCLHRVCDLICRRPPRSIPRPSQLQGLRTYITRIIRCGCGTTRLHRI